MHGEIILRNKEYLNFRKSKTSVNWKKWNIWVEKNGKPKCHDTPPKETEKTNIRFRKSGVMTKDDWEHFQKWSNVNAQPKTYETDLKEMENNLQYCPKVRKSYIYLKKMNPYPIQMHNTSLPEFKSFYTLSGKKYCCLDRDKEAEFWRYLRFPVSKSALRYNISKRIMNLSKPKVLSSQIYKRRVNQKPNLKYSYLKI